MPRLSAILLSLYFILFTFAPHAFGANLLEVRDVLSYPQTASVSAHNLYFSSPSTINNGFFRIQISDSFVFNAPITVSGTNVTGYTFSGGVATASSGYHNFEIHYSGSGPASTSLNLTIDSLTNPSSQNAYSYILSQYDSSANLINQSTGRVSIHNNPTVTAHVPDYTVSNPVLISPSDFAITNNPYEPFSFTRSYSIPGVDYYDLYLDDQLVAGNIDHDLLSQDYYFFKTLRQDETIHILLKQPLAEGTHTWYVKAYGVSGSRKSATSGKRSFTIDSVYPQIILTSIDNQILNWIVPDREDIIVRSSNPLFVGKVESLSNLKLSLIDLDSITIYEEDGNWEHRFHNLIPNHRYEVYIAATDKAGNSHIFPSFYITYEPFNIISYIFPTAIPTPTAVAPTVTPSPTRGEVGPSTKTPPPPPTVHPSPFEAKGEVGRPTQTFHFILYPLLLLGLLLHLGLTYFGASVSPDQSLSFLSHLMFPFMYQKDLQTISSHYLAFVTISLYNAEDLKAKGYKTISQVKGYFSLPNNLGKKVFLKITRPGFAFKTRILDSKTFKTIKKIQLEPKKSLKPLERLQLTSLAIRWLPLLIADLTGLIACILAFSPYYLTYTLISLQLTYSEYIYPESKN